MPPRSTLSPAQRTFMANLSDQLQQLLAKTPLVTRLSKATVVTVTSGAASDGAALAVVSWLGSDVPAPYLATYTPTVGHVVAVARTGPDLLILGRVIGTP